MRLNHTSYFHRTDIHVQNVHLQYDILTEGKQGTKTFPPPLIVLAIKISYKQYTINTRIKL